MITVIGESNIDIAIVKLRQAPNEKSQVFVHFGGVARNIAHNLRLLEQEVQLVSAFGDDRLAKVMFGQCKELGIDLTLSTIFENAKSPLFISHSDCQGNILSINPQVELNDRMDLTWIEDKIEAIIRSQAVVADTLISADALACLIDHCTSPLFIDTVSPIKAGRLSQALDLSRKKYVYALKCNLSEAVAITGENDAYVSAKKLNSMGINHVYLTLGPEGVVFCTEGKTKHFPALPVNVVNVAGSGDAFLAGVVYAYCIGMIGIDAVPFGLKTAQHNIKCEGRVNPSLRTSTFKD